MPYKVTVVGEIASLRAGDAGSRNVRISKGSPNDRVLTFNRRPTYLAELPAEVAADPMLVINEVSAEEMEKAGGRLLDPAAAAEFGEVHETAPAVDSEEEDDFEEEPMEDAVVVEGTEDPDKVNKSSIPKKPVAKPRGRRKKG